MQEVRAPEPGALKNPLGKKLPACRKKLILSKRRASYVQVGNLGLVLNAQANLEVPMIEEESAESLHMNNNR